MSRPVQLNLKGLVVQGLSPSQTAALGPLVRAELERLIASGGVPAGLARGGRVPAVPPVRAAAGMRPETIAAEVARAVYGAMGGRPSSPAHAPAPVRPPSPAAPEPRSPSPAISPSPRRPGTNGGIG